MRTGFALRPTALLAVAALVAAAGTASAQGNYRAVPTGGRSALMGNTGVAMSRDGSAPFLNPATIVAITDARLALSANIYALTSTALDSFHAPRGGDPALGRRALSDTTVQGIPSTFCLFLTLGDVAPGAYRADRKLALCAGTSEEHALSLASSRSSEGAWARALHLAALERRWRRVHVGPTYGRSIGDKLALGASLHLVDSSLTSLTSASASSVAGAPGGTASGVGGASSFTSSIEGTSFDLAVLLGATIEVDRATTIGLAFAPPSLHLGGTVDALDHAQQSGAGTTSGFARTRSATGAFAAPLPMRAAIGLGTRTRRLRFEVNATYFFPVAGAFASDVEVRALTSRGAQVDDTTARLATSARADGVLDSAVGAEWFVSDAISVLGGLATDFGASPRLAPDPPLGAAITKREHRGVATLGVGSYGNGSELLFGAQLALAEGQALVADGVSTPGALVPVDQRTTTLLFVIAGSTSLSTIRRTLDDLRHTLPLR